MEYYYIPNAPITDTEQEEIAGSEESLSRRRKNQSVVAPDSDTPAAGGLAVAGVGGEAAKNMVFPLATLPDPRIEIAEHMGPLPEHCFLLLFQCS